MDRAVKAAGGAFDEGPWGTMSGTERARLMRRFADLLAENTQELATAESTDNGKLLREMGGRYGLAAEIWTRDIQEAHRVAHALRAGTVWVNSYRTLSFNTSFGGYEMSGLESLKYYTQVKSVWVELSVQTRDPFTDERQR